MNKLISECNSFIGGGDFSYAICGGHGLELFTQKRIRPHSDIDISLFVEDRGNAVKFILEKGWDVYKHASHGGGLRLITDPFDTSITDCMSLWAIKPGSSLVKVSPTASEDKVFSYEIANDEQLHMDFIEIIFNQRSGTHFICNTERNVLRELDVAILSSGDIPYLAPELILFFKSHPEYAEHAYHKDKTPLDFDAVAPLLPRERREWLVSALQTTYPEGHIWLDRL